MVNMEEDQVTGERRPFGCLITLAGTVLFAFGGLVAWMSGLSPTPAFQGMTIGTAILTVGIAVLISTARATTSEKWFWGSIIELAVCALSAWWAVGLVGGLGYFFIAPVPLYVAGLFKGKRMRKSGG